MGTHSIILENRESLSISGVTEIDCYDDKIIILKTVEGELVIRGKNLKMHTANTETGNMSVSGEIGTLRYGDRRKSENENFLKRLFRWL